MAGFPVRMIHRASRSHFNGQNGDRFVSLSVKSHPLEMHSLTLNVQDVSGNWSLKIEARAKAPGMRNIKEKENVYA